MNVQIKEVFETENGVIPNPLFARHVLDRMNNKCPHCGVLFWLEEKSGGTNANPKFSICCAKGTIVIPHLEPPPQPLLHILNGNDRNCKEFKQNIRGYNTVLAFTCVSAKIDQSLATGRLGMKYKQL